jgi:hypothetical protein
MGVSVDILHVYSNISQFLSFQVACAEHSVECNVQFMYLQIYH